MIDVHRFIVVAATSTTAVKYCTTYSVSTKQRCTHVHLCGSILVVVNYRLDSINMIHLHVISLEIFILCHTRRDDVSVCCARGEYRLDIVVGSHLSEKVMGQNTSKILLSLLICAK